MQAWLPIVIVILGVISISPSSVSGENGTDSSQEGRIVGGRNIAIAQVPYLVALTVNGIAICGGSIMAAQWVLTAAHCVDALRPGQIVVSAGATDYRQGTRHIVTRKIVHPLYSRRNSDYDVALLQVSAISTGRKIAPAATEPPAGTSVIVAGWGSQQENGPGVTQVKAARLNIVARSACRREYGAWAITDRMICADGNGRDSCQGDSGGPLVAGDVQVGIVSWGAGCATPGFAGVYTNVAAVRSFITRYVKE